jgi:hypothetical protein
MNTRPDRSKWDIPVAESYRVIERPKIVRLGNFIIIRLLPSVDRQPAIILFDAMCVL